MEELTNEEIDLPDEKTVGYPVSYHSQDKFIVIRDVEIVFDRKADDFLDQRFAQNGPVVFVKKGVEFNNCTFPLQFWYLLRNVVFQDITGFRNCHSIQGIFKDCTFKHNLYLYNCEMIFFTFEDCSFEHGFDAIDTKIEDHLDFKNCQFSIQPALINHPRVHEDQNIIKNLSPEVPLFKIINRIDPFDLSIDSCTFQVDSSVINPQRFFIDLSSSQFNSLRYTHSSSNAAVNFSFTTIANQLSIHNCDLQGKILAEAFNFNTNNAKIEWKSLGGNKIAVYDTEQKIYLHADNLKRFRNDFYFNTLISTYALFYATYRQQGNRLSANACYIEWKNVETAYLKHIQAGNHDFNIYFDWLMNVFLKTFCDYGTNPIKSMIWSFYVMLGFALFYFFFPKQSGIYKGVSFQDKMHNMGKWFTEGKSFMEIFKENYEEGEYKVQDDEKFQLYIKSNKKKLPWYYNLFGRQWTTISKLYFGIKLGLYRVFDRLLGVWENKKGFKRFITSAGFALMVFTLLFVDLFVRLIDSLTTSLNAFSTLGFGEIPVRGIAKYLAVIEGFIGWFLLSIFSVALISQIIQ